MSRVRRFKLMSKSLKIFSGQIFTISLSFIADLRVKLYLPIDYNIENVNVKYPILLQA